MLFARRSGVPRAHNTRARGSYRVNLRALQGDALQVLQQREACETAAAATNYKRDPELQAALDALFADTVHQGHRRVYQSEIAHHVDRIAQLGARLGLNRVNPEWNDGAFRGLLTSIHSGISDEETCTLARLTFGKVQPAELVLQLNQAEAAGLQEAPDQLKGPVANADEDPARGYALVSYFKILSNGVVGRLTAKARYDLDEQDPAKLHVTFCGLLLEPALPDADSMALWRQALADHNPGMVPSGAIYIPLEPRPKAWVRYMVMEPDLNLALSHRGSLVTMQRV